MYAGFEGLAESEDFTDSEDPEDFTESEDFTDSEDPEDFTDSVDLTDSEDSAACEDFSGSEGSGSGDCWSEVLMAPIVPDASETAPPAVPP
ncbi:hypothetical protein GCM10010344_23390 [Streptomyces bluensis]|nr:hypothetical protein GCM10010344_23390 [Streptomyces bluensis]